MWIGLLLLEWSVLASAAVAPALRTTRLLSSALSAAKPSLADGIWKSFSMLMLGGLGDKSFLVTALMAMKYNRVTVFVSATIALLLVHTCSVAIAFVFDYIPVLVTKCISIALFVFFGAKMMWDVFHYKPSDTSSLDEAVDRADNILKTAILTASCVDPAETVKTGAPAAAAAASTLEEAQRRVDYTLETAILTSGPLVVPAPSSKLSSGKHASAEYLKSVQFYMKSAYESAVETQRRHRVPLKESMASLRFGRGRSASKDVALLNRDSDTSKAPSRIGITILPVPPPPPSQSVEGSSALPSSSSSKPGEEEGVGELPSPLVVHLRSEDGHSEALPPPKSHSRPPPSPPLSPAPGVEGGGEASHAPALAAFADMRQQTQPDQSAETTAALREQDVVIPSLKGRLLAKFSVCAQSVFLNVFFVIFLSEWGDRSQIATVALASQTDKYGVWLGGAISNLLLTALAVICGTILSRYVSERVLMFVGSLLFFAFGIQTIVETVQLYY